MYFAKAESLSWNIKGRRVNRSVMLLQLWYFRTGGQITNLYIHMAVYARCRGLFDVVV